MGNREKLLATAKRLIAEKGYGDITARDLVNESGTNLASIGYHFGSKEGLLTEAMLDSFGHEDEGIERLVGAAVDGGGAAHQLAGRDPGERLANLLDVLAEVFRADPRRTTASIEAFARAPHSPEVKERLAAVYQQYRRQMAAAVLGAEVDDLDPQVAHRVGSLALALIDGLALQALLDPGQTPDGKDILAALDLLRPAKRG
ncbi:TetR/AcrR family transcriptional regulator [Kribbella sp. CA-253562]|uniref:TetR/AcrR family transcriptional regulator n=1 Tax=Kribbella sp. CA-253562 TaxID=3239942 RepID=UPI003D93C66B